jgi:hypothetical protein
MAAHACYTAPTPLLHLLRRAGPLCGRETQAHWPKFGIIEPDLAATISMEPPSGSLSSR